MYGQPVGAYPYPPRRPGRGSLLTASTAQHPQKLFIVGIVLAVVSVVMVVFSCLSWTVSEVELKSADVTVSTSHSGLGGISKSVSGDDTDYFSRRDLRDAEREQEQDTDAPGAWTIVFGIVLGLAATALVARRFQPMAAFVAVLVGFASFITATVFFSDPVSAVFESWVDTSDAGAYFDRAYGIWFVFLGSIVALLAGVAALALVLLPEKFRPEAPRGFHGPLPTQFGMQQPFPTAPHPAQRYQPGGPPQYGQVPASGPAPHNQPQMQGWQPMPPPPQPRPVQQPGDYEQTQAGVRPPQGYGYGQGR
ncbi:hypothetical protein SAMN04488550_0818 [Gordonia malaquae]|nr:hypothetical protein SAMN04488550_0818 [Gordonia malaquae]